MGIQIQPTTIIPISQKFKRRQACDGRLTRRRVLTSGGTVIAAGLAGCLGAGTSDTAGRQTTPSESPEVLQINDRALSSAFPFEFVNPTADVENVTSHVTGDALVAHVQYHDQGASFSTHWHFDPLNIPLGETRQLRARFVFTDYSAASLSGDSRYRLRVSTPNDANTGVITVAIDEDIVSFTGEAVGSTQRRFELWDTQAEIVQWVTPALKIEVSENQSS